MIRRRKTFLLILSSSVIQQHVFPSMKGRAWAEVHAGDFTHWLLNAVQVVLLPLTSTSWQEFIWKVFKSLRQQTVWLWIRQRKKVESSLNWWIVIKAEYIMMGLGFKLIRSFKSLSKCSCTDILKSLQFKSVSKKIDFDFKICLITLPYKLVIHCKTSNFKILHPPKINLFHLVLRLICVRLFILLV